MNVMSIVELISKTLFNQKYCHVSIQKNFQGKNVCWLIIFTKSERDCQQENY